MKALSIVTLLGLIILGGWSAPSAGAEAVAASYNPTMVAWTPDVNMGQPNKKVEMEKHVQQMSPNEWLQYVQAQKPSAQPVNMASMQKQALSNNWRHVQGMVFDKEGSQAQWVNWPSPDDTH